MRTMVSNVCFGNINKTFVPKDCVENLVNTQVPKGGFGNHNKKILRADLKFL